MMSFQSLVQSMGLRLPCRTTPNLCDLCQAVINSVYTSGRSLPEVLEVNESLLRRDYVCLFKEKFRKLMSGTWIEINDCWKCNLDPSNIESSAKIDMFVTRSPMIIKKSMFSFPGYNTEIRVCEKGHSFCSLKCLAEVPEYFLVKTAELNGKYFFYPLIMNNDQTNVRITVDIPNTFNEYGVYVANPCYPHMREVLVASTVQRFKGGYALVQTERKYNLSPTMYCLSEVAEGKPFGCNSGKETIVRSLFFDERIQGGAQFAPVRFPKFSEPPPVFHLPHEDEEEIFVSEDEEENIEPPDEDVMNSVILSISTPENGVVSDDDIDFYDEFLAFDQVEYSQVFQHLSVLLQKCASIAERTLPVFFFSQSQFLNLRNSQRTRSCVGSSLQWVEGAQSFFTVPELRSKLKGNDMFLLAGDLGNYKVDRKPLNIKNAMHIDDQEFVRMMWSVDVDSIDAVAVAHGGVAFGKCLSRIAKVFQPYMIAPAKYLKRNNNLSKLPRLLREEFPGDYFLNESFSRSRISQYSLQTSDPVAFKVLDVQTVLGIDPLPVHAIIPSFSVERMVAGDGALLNVFLKFVNPNARESKVHTQEMRSFTHKLLWYLYTELIFLAVRETCGAVTKSQFPRRLPCCAVPKAGNHHHHYRRKGPTSSENNGISLGPGRLTLALCFLARFFRSLEIFSDVPPTETVSDFSCPEKYEVPEELLRYFEGSPEIRELLRRDINDPTNIECFRKHYWKGFLGNGLVDLSPDPLRKEHNAFPSTQTNLRAYENGHLVLQDLLSLGATWLRITRHGLRREIANAREVHEIREELSEQLVPFAFHDSIIDIAYVMSPPPELGTKFSIELPRATFPRDGGSPFIPSTSSERTNRSLGASMFSTPLYPIATGFQTSTLNIGEDRKRLSPLIKKVKIYKMTRHLETNRGESIYCTSPFYDLKKRLQSWRLTYCNLLGQREHPRKKRSNNSTSAWEERETIRRSYDQLFHDIDRRRIGTRDLVKGLRIEVTYSFGANFAALIEPELLLLSQKLRNQMSNLDIQYAHQDSNLGDSNRIPWWWLHNISTAGQNASDNFSPVWIVRDSVDLELDIELTYLQQSKELYLEAKNAILELPPRSSLSRVEVLRLFRESLSPSLYGEICLLMSWVSLETAKSMVESVLCNIRTGYMLDPPYIMQALGVDSSWFVFGYPCILVSRILGLDVRFRRPLFQRALQASNLRMTGSYRIVQQCEKEISINLDYECSMLQEDKTLSWTRYNRKLMEHIGLLHISDENSIRSKQCYYNLFVVISGVITHMVTKVGACQSVVPEDEGFRRLAVLITRVLVSDTCRSLEKFLNIRLEGNQRLHPVHEERKRRNFTYSDICKISDQKEGLESLKLSWTFHHKETEENIMSPEPTLHDIHKETVHQLLSFFPGPSTINSSLLQVEIHRRQFHNLNEDGTMKYSDFVKKLYKSSEYLNHFTDIINDEQLGRKDLHADPRIWATPVAFRIIEGVLEQEVRRLPLHKKNRLLLRFTSQFGGHLISVLRETGFNLVCPLIVDPEPDLETGHCVMWESSAPFTALRFGAIESIDLKRTQVSSDILIEGSQSGMARRSWSYTTRLTSFLTITQSSVQEISRILERLRTARRTSNINQLQAALRSYVMISRKYLSHRTVKEVMRCILWKTYRESDQYLDQNGNQNVFEWAACLLDKLIDLRIRVGDEGVASVSHSNPISVTSCVHSVRTKPSRPECMEAEQLAFPTTSSLLSKPIPMDFYQKSNIVGQRETKKTNVRKSGALLFKSGLAFKMKPKVGMKRIHSQRGDTEHDPLHEYRNLLVRDIFRQKDQIFDDIDVMCRSHAQWRLCPTEGLISIFHSTITELISDRL